MPHMGRYEELCETHEWEVPERYNIALVVCDKHPRDTRALVFESYTGEEREVSWGELQDRSNQIANALRERGVEVGDRVAMVLPPGPDTAAAFFAVWKCGALLLSMSVLYGDEGIRHRISDSEPKLLLTDAENRGRFEDATVLDDAFCGAQPTTFDVIRGPSSSCTTASTYGSDSRKPGAWFWCVKVKL
jgi:acetyl-CoA synthetase